MVTDNSSAFVVLVMLLLGPEMEFSLFVYLRLNGMTIRSLSLSFALSTYSCSVFVLQRCITIPHTETYERVNPQGRCLSDARGTQSFPTNPTTCSVGSEHTHYIKY